MKIPQTPCFVTKKPDGSIDFTWWVRSGPNQTITFKNTDNENNDMETTVHIYGSGSKPTIISNHEKGLVRIPTGGLLSSRVKYRGVTPRHRADLIRFARDMQRQNRPLRLATLGVTAMMLGGFWFTGGREIIHKVSDRAKGA